MRAESRVPENSRLFSEDRGGATLVGACPPLACNMLILVCYCFLVSSKHTRQIAGQSSLCEVSAGSAAGSLVTRMVPVCGSVSQTQAVEYFTY